MDSLDLNFTNAIFIYQGYDNRRGCRVIVGEVVEWSKNLNLGQQFLIMKYQVEVEGYGSRTKNQVSLLLLLQLYD